MGTRCGSPLTTDGKDWISSEMLSKDMTEASKSLETLDEVDRLVCGSIMHRNWQEDLKELDLGPTQGNTVPHFIGGAQQ